MQEKLSCQEFGRVPRNYLILSLKSRGTEGVDIKQILHVDLDAFFVSVEQVNKPELRGKPVIVGGIPGSRGVVAAASYEARAYGIKSAMPISTAYRLCPAAVFLPGNYSQYREVSAKFMNILAGFTPDIESMGLDEAYLDITGFEMLYGPARNTAITIKQRIKNELGIIASVGISTSKVVSKVASALSKPDGLIEVKPGEEKKFLAPLPVGKLPWVGLKSEEKLKNFGITTIGKLADCPVNFLIYTFGSLGAVMHQFANGIDDSPIETHGEVKSISRETTFGSDTQDCDLLKANLRYLSERVGAALRREGKRAKCINLKLRYTDFETISRSYTIKSPVNSDQVIYNTALDLLNREFKQKQQMVRLIGIGVSNLVTDEKQLSLIDPTPEKMDKLSKTVDNIRNRYGFTAIQTGQTLSLGFTSPIKNTRPE
ncbi:MAG: DNA polymerase IV [Chloroflexi bacterium]|nr:DNA polymerase IV [Chloroflexota bacterium]